MTYNTEWVDEYKFLNSVLDGGMTLRKITPVLRDRFGHTLRLSRSIVGSFMSNFDELKKDGVI